MEEKKNIRELAVQYFEGRIRRKDEKLLFEYVGQSEANRTAFRQWEKEWIASGITDSNTTKEWETLQRKIRTQEDYPDAGYFENEIFRLAESGCCRSHRTSDYVIGLDRTAGSLHRLLAAVSGNSLPHCNRKRTLYAKLLMARRVKSFCLTVQSFGLMQVLH